MFNNTFTVAFISNQITAFASLKNWTQKAFYNRIDLFTQSSYTLIIPGLYLSNARAAADRNVLRRLNITHVLTVEIRRLPKSTFQDSDMSTLFIRAYDTPHTNLMPYFPISNAFIDEGLKKGNVVVHCHFGVSRSATLVIAYIMYKYKMPFEEAYYFVRKKRKFISPNPGFVRQLKEYERANYNVGSFRKFEAYVNVHARKHKYKIASVTAVLVGIAVSLAFFVAL